MPLTNHPLSIYIHWPFCRKKCPYCDFNSHVRGSVDYERWQKALLRELETQRERVKEREVVSVFFGGGTPSLMPPSIVEALLKRIGELWQLSPTIEITLEANPTSTEAENFKALRLAGVNRVSLGVQSLRDEELRFLGREHSAKEALKAVELAAKTFDRYSFDLIYARPHQTVETWERELREAFAYAGDHLSLYQLTVEEETPFARVYAKGGFKLPDEDTAADLYELTAAVCAEHGLHAYEISNYAKPGQECRHNLAYWRGDEYLGVGPGAHGRLREGAGRQVSGSSKNLQNRNPQAETWYATATVKSPERWLTMVEEKGEGLEQYQSLSPRDRAEELVLSGLRLAEGLSFKNIAEKTGIPAESCISYPQAQALQTHKLLHINGDSIVLTPSGRLLTNQIIPALLQTESI
ncbi:MAG: radical SAM family heme chaperone HemW [Rickettsiales bacterium]